MKKQLIGIILCMMMLATVPFAAGQFTKEDPIVTTDIEPNSLLGVTFIAGLILNPEKIGNMVSAKVLALAYYDRGLIFKDGGISLGLKTVRFRDGELLYMSEPNEYGISQVFGICTSFYISK
ncbi:MAG: hypothetical protein V1769_06235 [Thermoplasmatota archaeon]